MSTDFTWSEVPDPKDLAEGDLSVDLATAIGFYLKDGTGFILGDTYEALRGLTIKRGDPIHHFLAGLGYQRITALEIEAAHLEETIARLGRIKLGVHR